MDWFRVWRVAAAPHVGGAIAASTPRVPSGVPGSARLMLASPPPRDSAASPAATCGSKTSSTVSASRLQKEMKLDLASFELNWSSPCAGPTVGRYTCARGIEVILHIAHSGRAAVYLRSIRAWLGSGAGSVFADQG